MQISYLRLERVENKTVSLSSQQPLKILATIKFNFVHFTEFKNITTDSWFLKKEFHFTELNKQTDIDRQIKFNFSKREDLSTVGNEYT